VPLINPDVVYSIIIDGADQSAFGLPHFVLSTKGERGNSLKVKMVGVMEHGAATRSSLFLMTGEFETGANHVIEAMHRTLCDRVTIGRLPDISFVRMDDCTRENKNRFTSSYLEYLVRRGVFIEVTASSCQ